MPPSRWLSVDRLNCRSNTGTAGAPVAGAFTITSNTLPAGRNTSFWIFQLPGWTLPSSAISAKPGTATLPPAGITCVPTMDGTCMRRPALTKRTRTWPVSGVTLAVENCERAGLLRSNATPLIR